MVYTLHLNLPSNLVRSASLQIRVSFTNEMYGALLKSARPACYLCVSGLQCCLYHDIYQLRS